VQVTPLQHLQGLCFVTSPFLRAAVNHTLLKSSIAQASPASMPNKFPARGSPRIGKGKTSGREKEAIKG
jgi:hypothetical protein